MAIVVSAIVAISSQLCIVVPPDPFQDKQHNRDENHGPDQEVVFSEKKQTQKTDQERQYDGGMILACFPLVQDDDDEQGGHGKVDAGVVERQDVSQDGSAQRSRYPP